ncbi:hypothetical protein JCM6882_007254 [Rhodosporidiobolus microsporus]
MSVPSFAGAPVSKALAATVTIGSVLAAITATQQYFHLPIVPHLSRDHQFFRFLSHHLVFNNSSELVLGIIVLWYASPSVERMFGTRKFASFVLVTTALSTALTAVVLGLGWQLTRGRFNGLPAGPFAIFFAIVYQSHRLVPTVYYFRLFHPALTLTNRFPLYILALLLATAQPPASLLVTLIGLTSSLAYTFNFLGMREYRLSPRLYSLLARVGGKVFGDPRKMRVRRGNAVTPEEAMITALLGGAGAGGGGASALDLISLRGQAQQQQQRPAEAPVAPAANGTESAATEAAEDAAAESDEGVAAAHPAPSTPAAAAPAAAEGERPMPRIPGRSFLRQWQAGLTGAAEGPSAEQIAELTAIFPHHTRQAIVAALQQHDLNTTRAAEALLTAGS